MSDSCSVVAKFEFVSEDQFNKDSGGVENFHLQIPKRSTKGSAGYDFYLPYSIIIEPGEGVTVSTGIRCKMQEGYVLMIYPRSSMGIKFGLSLANTVGVIDSDYYDSSNEGHILIRLINNSNYTVSLEKGTKFCQGIFTKYYLADEDAIISTRNGGFGSTD